MGRIFSARSASSTSSCRRSARCRSPPPFRSGATRPPARPHSPSSAPSRKARSWRDARGSRAKNPHTTTSRWLAGGLVFAVDTPAGRLFSGLPVRSRGPPSRHRARPRRPGQGSSGLRSCSGLTGVERPPWRRAAGRSTSPPRPMRSWPRAAYQGIALRGLVARCRGCHRGLSPPHRVAARPDPLAGIEDETGMSRFVMRAPRATSGSPRSFRPTGRSPAAGAARRARQAPSSSPSSTTSGRRTADRRVAPNQYIDRILAPAVTCPISRPSSISRRTYHSISVSRAALIRSTSRRYPWTIEQAVLLRQAAPEADGFAWVSQARDTSLSVVLYGDRGDPDVLVPGEGRCPAAGSWRRPRSSCTLAEAARITIVLPD